MILSVVLRHRLNAAITNKTCVKEEFNDVLEVGLFLS